MGKVINSALLGAFAATMGQPDINVLCDVIFENAPTKKQENVAACREAFALLSESARENHQGTSNCPFFGRIVLPNRE